MKKCRRCSNPATLHITEIHDGHAVAIHLCEKCAREYLKDEDESGHTSPAAELAAKLEQLASEEGEDALAALKCPNCEITFNEFREHGRLGCPTCYQEFRQELLPLLENIHEDSHHVGKRPLRSPEQTPEQTEVIRLRKQQRDAVEREEYERAAELRDRIAEIESMLHRLPGGIPDAPG